MEYLMSNEQLQELAQELVDNTRKMKDLEQDIELLKLDIYDAAKGGIVCKGGRLVFIQEHTVQNLDFEKLMYALRNDIGLSEEKIAEITTKSQKVSNRYPAIAVYLDKM
jgi:TPP-dependent indolepyruvate ferredoxin oxidoreductase alpha subunit